MSSPNGPSPHLSWKELACKDGTPYPQEFRLDERVYKLADMFEKIRALWGKPLVIHSAYRTPAWNKKIGGAKNSMHVQGRALDIAPPKGVKIEDFYFDIKFHAAEFGIKGIGRYPTFVHVDIRPTAKLVAWSANGIKDSGTNA